MARNHLSGKMLDSVLLVQAPDGKTYVHWKGAAEIVLEFCTSTLAPDGTLNPLDAPTVFSSRSCHIYRSCLLIIAVDCWTITHHNFHSFSEVFFSMVEVLGEGKVVQ